MELEPLIVNSTRVALQEPTVTVAAPVSALRFEPQVDVQARSFAEGQADVTIRGGTFENTGFVVGALPLYDPQTGHYAAEIPVSPQMLGAPAVRVGSAQAAAGFNATAGGVVYGWRPVRTGGALSMGAGGDALARGEAHAGVAGEVGGGYTVGADIAVASSQGDGTRPDGDHDFNRYNARVQISDARSQTDVFAGYQSKFFGWRNLYARGDNPETENLQTKLFLLNHRVELEGDGDYIQAGTYHRGNKDDYEFNRNVPGQFNPFKHKTLVRGAAADGRVTVIGATAARFELGVVGDEMNSSNLGQRSRTQSYGGLGIEHRFDLGERGELTATAGVRRDDSNRDSGETSPVASLSWQPRAGGVMRTLYASYGASTQVPTYQALYGTGLFAGSPGLPRATAENYEIGAEVALVGWTAQTAVFFRRDEELLDYVFTSSGSARSAVAVDLDTVGLELFVRREWERFDLFFGYTFIDKNDDYTVPNGGSFYALNYAEHRLTLSGVARLGGGFELRMDNELRRQADNALRRGGRDNVDTALGLYYFVPSVKGLVLNAQVENVWDTYYEDVPLVPGARRAWSVGASYVW